MSFDQQKESLLRFGVVYVLKYLGSVEILCSMRQLQFNERRKLTRECIKEVSSSCTDGRNHTQSSEYTELVLNGMVADNIDLFLSGVDILLTVSVEMLKVARKDTHQIFLTHQMELVSFASGGEGTTSDCIAYVAKDETNRRVCYVLKSMSGLESMIISTIGQAFDLKYSDSLKNESYQPLEDDKGANNSTSHVNDDISQTNHVGSSEHKNGNLNNFSKQDDSNFVQPIRHPIPIRPKDTILAYLSQPSNRRTHAAENLDSELWFHGNISRAKAEELLRNDGDFLVRECSQIPGQYVLSGRYASQPRHLLLVDPEGVVRTRGCRFDSISHLIYHHQQKRISIVSPDSELLLINPIIRSKRS